MDMKYGLGFSEWDKERHTYEELLELFNQFDVVTSCTFHTAVIWCGSMDMERVTLALQASKYNNIQTIYWHKLDHNAPKPQHLLVPSVECGLLAFKGTAHNFSTMFDLPASLHDRHNITFGPGQRSYDKDDKHNVVNKCQKPPYLSESFAKRYCSHGSTVMVCGSGAGGDVAGFMNRGLNVVAIEQDEVQWRATHANLRAYKPKQDLNMLFTYADFRDQITRLNKPAIGNENPDCNRCPPREAGASFHVVSICFSCAGCLCAEHWPDSTAACPQCGVVPVERIE